MPRTFFSRSFGNNVGGTPPATTVPTLAVTDNADGTGGVATVSGGDAGALQTLYRAPFDTGSPNLTFASVGSRTGNGTIAAPGPTGSYIWRVVANLAGAEAVSNLVLRALTSLNDPAGGGVYWSILQSLQARIAALGLGISVRVRKKLIRISNDPTPLIIIAPGPGGEVVKQQTFGRRVIWRYPVAVAILTAGNQQLEAGLQAGMARREAIRNEVLQASLPGAVKVYNADIDPEEIAKFNESLGTNFDATGFVIYYQTAETRKG
jgi:hypothetical protein